MTPAYEPPAVARRLLAWLDGCPCRPAALPVLYGMGEGGAPALALLALPGGAPARRYITGGGREEYRFKLVYRLSAGPGSHARLQADEALEGMARWMCAHAPDLGEGTAAARVELATHPAMAAARDGDEDHEICFILRYEVK